MEYSEERRKATFWRGPTGIALIVFGAFAALLLITEHRAHAPGALAWLILLACPLLHLFMHRSHDGHRAPFAPPAPAASAGDGAQTDG